MSEEKPVVELSHKLLRGEYLQQAITTAMEVIAREELYPLDDNLKRVALRVRRNSTRDRHKLIKDADIVSMIKVGRIHSVIPEYLPKLKIRQ